MRSHPRTALSFRYSLRSAPVATAAVDIGHVGITFSLVLDGDLDVLATAQLNNGTDPQAALRASALDGLRGLTRGLMVRGVDAYAPTITSSAGHRFSQTGREFRVPNTVVFAGDSVVDYAAHPSGCAIEVRGGLRYALEVTALPHRGPAVPEQGDPTAARAWFVRHEQELASIGAVVLAALPVAPGPLVFASA